MLKKVLDLFTKKSYSNNTQTSFIGNNLLSCGSLIINNNDKYRFLKTNSDVRRSNDYISKKIWLRWLVLQDSSWEELSKQDFPEEYKYLNNLFSDWTFLKWKRQLITNTNISWENYFQPVEWIINWGKITKFETIDTRAILKNFNANWSLNSFSVIPLWFWDSKMVTTDEIWYFIYEDDPVNPWYWFWIIDWIIFDILADREAWRTNYYTFENNWIPWAIFTLDESITKREDVARAAEDLKNKFQWSSNTNKIAASPYIKDVKVLNISNKDLEYIGWRKFSSEKIASAFWLHKKLLGYEWEHWSYSEITEIRKEVYETTIKWFESYVENIMNSLVEKFSNKLEIDLSKYTIKLKSENFEDIMAIENAQREDYKLWLKTANQILTERWLPETEDVDYWNSRYIANNLAKVWAIVDKQPKQ